MFVHQRLAVPEFRGQRHLHRTAEQSLPGVLPHHPSVIGRAAGNHVNAGNLPGLSRRQADVVQYYPALPNPGRNGLAQGLRLFQDFFEHEVGVPPLPGGGRVPVNAAALLFQRGQLIIEHVHALSRQHGDLPVVHVGHFPRVPENGRGVGGDEVFPLPKANNQRTVLPGGDEGVGVIGANNAKGVRPLNPPQAAAHGLQHIPALVVVELQQMGHDFRVGLRGKNHSLPGQLLFQFQVVFNDSVVYQGNLSVAADVGMGVGVIGFPMGGPTGVPDSQYPLQIRAIMSQVRQDL